jgi:hypothetical protein
MPHTKLLNTLNKCRTEPENPVFTHPATTSLTFVFLSLGTAYHQKPRQPCEQETLEGNGGNDKSKRKDERRRFKLKGSG